MAIHNINPDSLAANAGESLIILNSETLKYYEASNVAARIWSLLESGPASDEEIVRVLLSEFEVTEDRCRDAVANFLVDAESRGLIQSNDGA